MIGITSGKLRDRDITAVTSRKYEMFIILHEVIVVSVGGILSSVGFHVVVVPGGN